MEEKTITIFYGDLSPRGYVISSLLYEKQIQHYFQLIDGDFVLSFRQIRDISGFDRIREYLERYEYVFDLRD